MHELHKYASQVVRFIFKNVKVNKQTNKRQCILIQSIILPAHPKIIWHRKLTLSFFFCFSFFTIIKYMQKYI